MKTTYSKHSYCQAAIEFTDTGHVDMDAFDENRGDTEVKVLAEFYDEEAESLCRPLLEKLGVELAERNKDEPVADEITVVRESHKFTGSKSKPLDISFFWGVGDWENDGVLDAGNGFDVRDYGWDENTTDINDKPYEWDSKNLHKQIPKEEDFISVCQKELAQELRFAFGKDTDGFSYDDEVRYLKDKLDRMIVLHRNLYLADDWNAESEKWEWC
tara:strand:+ start:1676 stop:2320 length:645 start_codon:yes stop_codon:yes gene_type:complete